MGIFDVFTGKPAKEAAAQSRAIYDQTRTQGNTDITAGLNSATGYLQGGAAAGRSDLAGGYGNATGAVNSGADSALGYLGNGTSSALDYLNQAGGAYSPLSALGGKYGGATTMALNALGVNGQAGTDAARSAFQAGPAYNFNMDQGLEAINRRRNAGGMLNSGNADRDAQTFGAGLASNEYDKWLGNLQSYVSPEMSATSGAAAGQAGALTNSANVANSGGLNSANIASGRGAMLSSLANQYGINTAGLDTGEGQSLSGLATGAAGQKVGLASSLAQPYANTYKQEADAQLAGSGNLWKLGMAGAQLAMTPPTGLMGIGGGAAPSAGMSYDQPMNGSGMYTGDPSRPGFAPYRPQGYSLANLGGGYGMGGVY